MLYIGIDPGQKTGFATWDGTTLEFDTVTFWVAYDRVLALQAKRSDLRIYVENPAGNKAVFNRGLGGARRVKVAQDVGMNKREGTLLIEGLRRKGVSVTAVTPTSAKWTRADMKLYTGYGGRSNEHERDAVKLIWGRMSDGRP